MSESFKRLLDLSAPEIAVMDALLKLQMPRRVTPIANAAAISVRMTNRILHNFEKRGIVIRKIEPGEHHRWRFNKKLNYFIERFKSL